MADDVRPEGAALVAEARELLREIYEDSLRPDVAQSPRSLLRSCRESIEALAAEVERLTQAHERLRDLARHQRGELLEAGLITRAEYADLLSDSGSVKRLEMYDQLKAENARLREALERHMEAVKEHGHSFECAIFDWKNKCDCGWQRFLDTLASADERT